MATFVIVHGGFGGGWEWTPVARVLRARGHEVFTPTLTGMGERSHVGLGERIGLSVHVEDVVSVLEFEDLYDVVLCAGSYGGMPVTAAADRAAHRIALVVYVDALVPRYGQSALELLPAGFGEMVRSGIAEHGDAWRVPLPPALRDNLVPDGSLAPEHREWYLSRARAQPAASFVEAVQLSGAVERLQRAFVRSTASRIADELGDDPIEPCAQRARAEGWPYRELATLHDPQLFEPLGTADALVELAAERLGS